MSTHIRFSPIEEQILAKIGEGWADIHELQVHFYPDVSPNSVSAAVAYLRRKMLITPLERRHGHPFFEQTQLGTIVLAEYRRGRPLLRAVRS